MTRLPAALLLLACTTQIALAQTPDPLQEIRQQLAERDAREAELRQRLEALETEVRTERRLRIDLEDEVAATRAEEADATIDERLQLAIHEQVATLLPAEQTTGVTLGGYFDIEFRRDAANGRTTFDQHRLILQIAGDIVEDAIGFKTEIEFEGGGADASFLSGNEIVVEYGEVHFYLDDRINVKAGALLVPFGRFNRLHDSPLRDLTDRPLVNRYIVPTTWVDAGIGIYGAFNSEEVTVSYDVMLGNGLDDDFSSTPGGGFRGNRNSLRRDNNDNKQVIGRIGVQPYFDFADVTEFGFSFGYGMYDDASEHTILMLGFDWRIAVGPFEFLGEYAFIDLERDAAQIAAGAPGQASGYYLQVNWHFFPDSWRDGGAWTNDQSTFTLVTRFGMADTDDSGTGVDRGSRGAAFRDDLKRLTFGVNYRPVEGTVIKFEYQFLLEDGVRGADNDRIVMSIATYF